MENKSNTNKTFRELADLDLFNKIAKEANLTPEEKIAVQKAFNSSGVIKERNIILVEKSELIDRCGSEMILEDYKTNPGEQIKRLLKCDLVKDHVGCHEGFYNNNSRSLSWTNTGKIEKVHNAINSSIDNSLNSISDPVSKPSHYTKQNYFGKECIDIIAEIPNAYFGFCIGNAIKYLFRWDTKHDLSYVAQLEDLKKAKQYIFFIQEKVKNGINYDVKVSNKIQYDFLDTVLELIQNEIELFEKYIYQENNQAIESIKTIIKSTTNIIIKMLLTFYSKG